MLEQGDQFEARTRVALGIERTAAQGAWRTATGDQLAGTVDERGDLRPGDEEPGTGGFDRRLLLLLGQQLLRDEHHAVVALVPRDGQRPDDPFGDDGFDQIEQRRHRGVVDGREVREQPGEVVRQRADLLLLALEGDDDAVALRLEVEDALPGLDRPRPR